MAGVGGSGVVAGSGAVTYGSISAVPAGYTGLVNIAGVAISYNNGYIVVNSDFRLSLAGTGAVSIDTIDYLGIVSPNAFIYSLPTDVGMKKYNAETITGIKITYSSTATVVYLL
jgi:hypothetical protein